jgi:protein O-GlcNAc transferase
MGVQVVAWPQGTHVSRIGAGLLARVGHAEWIANSPDTYAEIAATLVSDGKSLSRVRRTLRQDFIAGGLTDGASLARELEAAYLSFRS